MSGGDEDWCNIHSTNDVMRRLSEVEQKLCDCSRDIKEQVEQMHHMLGRLTEQQQNLEKETVELHREIVQLLKQHQLREQIDVRQQNLNLRQALPFPFKPQKTHQSFLPMSGTISHNNSHQDRLD